MLLFVSRAQVIGNGMTGAGAALLTVLVFVGIIHAFLAGLFAALAAALVTLGLLIASSALRWDAGFKPKPLFLILSNAFTAMTVVTWLLDLALQTYYTVPTTIVAMDYQTCDPNCPAGTFSAPGSSAIIQSVGDYYRVFVAGAPGGWLAYVLHYIPGTLAFAWVLGSGEPDAFQDRIAANIEMPRPGQGFAPSATAHLRRGKLKRLAVVSVLSVVAAQAIAFPLFLHLFLGLLSTMR